MEVTVYRESLKHLDLFLCHQNTFSVIKMNDVSLTDCTTIN